MEQDQPEVPIPYMAVPLCMIPYNENTPHPDILCTEVEETIISDIPDKFSNGIIPWTDAWVAKHAQGHDEIANLVRNAGASKCSVTLVPPRYDADMRSPACESMHVANSNSNASPAGTHKDLPSIADGLDLNTELNASDTVILFPDLVLNIPLSPDQPCGSGSEPQIPKKWQPLVSIYEVPLSLEDLGFSSGTDDEYMTQDNQTSAQQVQDPSWCTWKYSSRAPDVLKYCTRCLFAQPTRAQVTRTCAAYWISEYVEKFEIGTRAQFHLQAARSIEAQIKSVLKRKQVGVDVISATHNAESRIRQFFRHYDGEARAV